MSEALHEKAKSSKSTLDKGLQETQWKRSRQCDLFKFQECGCTFLMAVFGRMGTDLIYVNVDKKRSAKTRRELLEFENTKNPE